MGYVSDAELYQRLEGRVTSLRSWQVGRASPYTSRRYFDWLEFLVKGPWPYIIELAHLSGDTSIYFYDLEQAKASLFVERFGVYPLVQLDIHMTEPEYIAVLNEEPGSGQRETFAVANANSDLIFLQSGKWHVHGEYLTGMAELASYVGIPADTKFPHDFWDETKLHAFSDRPSKLWP